MRSRLVRAFIAPVCACVCEFSDTLNSGFKTANDELFVQITFYLQVERARVRYDAPSRRGGSFGDFDDGFVENFATFPLFQGEQLAFVQV